MSEVHDRFAPRVEQIRCFRGSDWINAIIACPHCGQLLEVVVAEGPYVGMDPSADNRIDRYWILTLEDGASTRMWEDRKGVIVNPRVTS